MITQSHTEAFDSGVAAAKAELAASDSPILVMDEAGINQTANSHAMGWNSIWASEENGRRWATVKIPDTGDKEQK